MLSTPEEIAEPQSVPNTTTQKAAEFLRQLLRKRWFQATAGVILIPAAALLTLAGFYYIHYSKIIDQRLSAGAFADSMNIYAGPLTLTTGDALTIRDLAAELETAGYEPGKPDTRGAFQIQNDEILVVPKEDVTRAAVRIRIAKEKIASIIVDRKFVQEYSLGTPLMSTISSHREKRHLVTFAEIPRTLVEAVVSIEDKHFFQHSGLDVMRVAKAAYVDMKDGRKEQGASTLTMQLVRGLWLDPEKRWTRKASEALMTLHLERRWSKEKIFETYANQIYLGRQQSYAFHGFGQAALALFGKDLGSVTLPEAALLAGLVQRPSYFNPFRYPDRATERRNLVLTMMQQNGYVSARERDEAIAAPLGIIPESQENQSIAPYFLDLVSQELQIGERTEDAVRDVYTTLDLNLQRAAEDALTTGLTQVDKLLAKRNGGGKVQAALIAIDPHTGEIKALSGGRDYADSQLNRILAKRPPGSVFKPFVYAAALNSAVDGGSTVFTPATTVEDIATTFLFDGKPYQPGNFHQAFHGTVTLRQALAHSMNVAAVKVAQGVGFDRVVAMARRAGMNDGIKATPAVALGAYDTTPLEIAGAYTLFANGGTFVKPSLVSEVRNASGQFVVRHASESHQALDPRVAYLMVSMLEEVMRTGTAAGVRSRGFTLPAAGKTGTSHDGWFAGFTSQLLCVVWVGYDDYRELNLEGARSALPIWTEFMKRASKFGAYRNAREFAVPAGIEQMRICSESGKLAGQYCLETRNEYFVEGSEPSDKCDQHDFPMPPPVNSTQGFQPYIPPPAPVLQ